MSEIALARINNFAPRQADVPTSEEPIFVLTSSQLQEIVSRTAVPLLARIEALEARGTKQDEKIATLEAEDDHLAENQFIQLQLINKLRHVPQEGDEVPILDELYNEMKAMGRKQTDFATAARMVKRSKARLFQLKATIALDQRFILISSESHSQKLLIRLREFYKPI
jgi:uncharacterized coiled-coil protein SlyX